MNIAEQIKSFENKRAALAASQSDIMSKAFDEGRTLDAEETESYDNVSSEIKSVDEHLKRLRDMEASIAATAKPVTKLPMAKSPPLRQTRRGSFALSKIWRKVSPLPVLPRHWRRQTAAVLKRWKLHVSSTRMMRNFTMC